VFVDRYVNPAIGDVPLRRLRSDHLDGLYEHLVTTGGWHGTGLAPKTVSDVHMIVRAALDLAVQRELLDTNVAHAATARRRPPTKACARTWTAQELALGQLTDPEHREATIAAVLAAETDQPAEPTEIQTARRAMRELPVELDRVLAAIRAGMDPDLATSTTKQIQRELAAAQATIATWEHEHLHAQPLSAEDIHQALEHASDLAGLLNEAERETRARLYRTLDLVLNLDPLSETLRPWTFGCSYVVAGVV